MTETRKPPKKAIIGVGLVLAIGLAVKFLLFREPFFYAGTLEATQVNLSARIASAVERIEVQEGAHVTEGQELVAFSCEDIKVASKFARENYDRALRLLRSGSVSQEVMDQTKSKNEEAEVRLGWCSLRSPIAGTVLNRYREPGEWVTPGTKVLTLANTQDIWTTVYVPQPEVAFLQLGMKVKGYLPELNHQEFEGEIVKISSEAEFTPKNVQTRSERTRLVYGVKVNFLNANKSEVLKPGMTIEIKLPEKLPSREGQTHRLGGVS